MLKEARQGHDDEPVLYPGAARILLLMTGRAVEAGECLVATDLKPDSITRAAFEIYDGAEEGTLSEVIEEITGCPPVIHPAMLGKIAAPAIVEHAKQLGMPSAEAAQISA
jgi:hypothetical protein